MASTHVVAQGEHLTSIADQYGFTDYASIWDHANNASLKQSRGNPNVLYPGDSLYIPDKQQKEELGATTKRHVFKLKQSRLMLRVLVEDAFERPVANASCVLTLDQERSTLASDGSGKLEKQISPTATEGTMVLDTQDTAFQGDVLQISIGALDPVETLTGQAARLDNLGYCAGTPASAEDPQFVSAVEEFQCDHALAVDGLPGPQTRAKLKQVHGC